MSQVLNVELSEEVFAAIQRQAKSAGISPALWVADMLENQYRFSSEVSEERQKARERFEAHFGEVDLGHPTGIDNEQIDEDLARAYADTHEAG
jgi:hypothetical protein